MSRENQAVRSGRGFFSAVSILVGGTVAGNVVTALAMPILSRLYDPADFGTLAVFMGIVTTVAVAACLRYDVAVALPESDDESVALLVLSLAAALGVSLLMLLVVAMGFGQFSKWITDPGILLAKWMIPIGVFSSAAWSALQSWHIRQHNYGLIAKARLSQSTIAATTQTGGAFFIAGSLGLVSGPTLAFFATAVLFLQRSWKEITGWFRRNDIAALQRAALDYRRFPAYSTWEALFNQAAVHLPIIFIASVTTTAEAGYIMLAMYVLQAPMSLLGGAVAQAYLSKAPAAYREGNLAQFTNEVLTNLIKVGAGPIIAVGILSPVFFPLLFGAGWDRAGWLVAWMTPWFLLQFLASPVSMSLHVVNAQRAAMLLQMFSLLVRLGMTWLAAQFARERVAEIYALSGAVVYLGYFVVIQMHLGGTRETMRGMPFRAMARWVVPWILGALPAAFAIAYFMTRFNVQ